MLRHRFFFTLHKRQKYSELRAVTKREIQNEIEVVLRSPQIVRFSKYEFDLIMIYMLIV